MNQIIISKATLLDLSWKTEICRPEDSRGGACKRVFCNNTKSLANKTTNFVNVSYLLIWGNYSQDLHDKTAREPSIYTTERP